MFETSQVVSLLQESSGMHVCLVGGRCVCGKSTRAKIAAKLLETFGVTLLDTSTVIKEEIEGNTDLGRIFAQHTEDCMLGGLQPDEPTLLAIGKRLQKGKQRGHRLAIVVGTSRTPGQSDAIIRSGLDFSCVEFLADDYLIAANLARRRAEGRPDDLYLKNRELVHKFITVPALAALRKHRPDHYHEIDASPAGLLEATKTFVGVCTRWHHRYYGQYSRLLHNPENPATQMINQIMAQS